MVSGALLPGYWSLHWFYRHMFYFTSPGKRGYGGSVGDVHTPGQALPLPEIDTAIDDDDENEML